LTNRYNAFALFMAVAVMILAVAALPGMLRVALLVPAFLGAVWAFLKLRRASTAGRPDAAGRPREGER
jgi:hypothetical protein